MQDLTNATDDELLSLQQLVASELNKREGEWRKRLAKLQIAKHGGAPRQRAVRSDKGKPKVPRALANPPTEFANGMPDPRVEVVVADEDFGEEGHAQ